MIFQSLKYRLKKVTYSGLYKASKKCLQLLQLAVYYSYEIMNKFILFTEKSNKEKSANFFLSTFFV